MEPQWQSTTKFILLPELKLVNQWHQNKFRTHYKCMKESEFEDCPKCATKSYSVHDRRWVKIKDQPIRGTGMTLHVLKRRFRCPGCRKVFTEPLSGVQKGYKTTHRYRRGLRWACGSFKNLTLVQRAFEELIDDLTSRDRKEELIKASIEYCKKDTLVMAELVKWLFKVKDEN